MDQQNKGQMRKMLFFLAIVLAAFTIGLMLGGSKAQNLSYKSKASESTQAVPTSPNLIGTITSIVNVNGGNKTVVLLGLSKADYDAQAAGKSGFTGKKYFLIVTPQTQVVKLSNNQVLTINDLTNNINAAMYISSDAVTVLKVEVK